MSFHDDASTASSEGAAFPWILEHLLAYPGSYEIPLRTMYTLNSTTQAQPQQPNQPNPSPTSANSVPGNAFPAQRKHEQHNLTTATAAAQLRANLMSHISQLPSQPCSLPPSFVTSFVRKCFPHELNQVDFPQALTALDYLKDLEIRRRREVVAALDRLGVDRADLGERAVLGRKYPGVLRWVISIEDKERKVEALYTQVYLGLRRWVGHVINAELISADMGTDSNQRALPYPIQQSQLYRHVEHSLPTSHDTQCFPRTTHTPAYTGHSFLTAEWLLSLYHGCGEERDCGFEESSQSRSEDRRRVWLAIGSRDHGPVSSYGNRYHR